ncbi:ribonuclease P protein subunit p25-like protein [Drosophila innubila]|uniref:ribonuclease P protein subunit p25-like protein n=1 Tax=Drosophila innubila TaxID=198719 RepID=UPI00148DE9EC|nr:ribonuclease P protein subunit p25-like protein [Drosophila innubila]
MMHYRKAENVEQELSKSDLPFENCLPKDHNYFLWMHVKGGTKLSNVVDYAKSALDKGEYRSLVWSGSGGGVIKTISCAEVMKRSYPLYQLTRMAYTSVEEHWKPQMDGLEEIIATRQIPTLHILMSLDALPDNIEGVQNPNTTSDYWQHDETKGSRSRGTPGRTNKRPRTERNNKPPNQQQQQQQMRHQQQKENQLKPDIDNGHV